MGGNRFIRNYIVIGLALITAGSVILYYALPDPFRHRAKYDQSADWDVPDINALPDNPQSGLIRYGKALIVNTAKYLGPKGSVAHLSNGMNCENCHLDAGTRLNGNCLAMAASTFPRYRERSGRVESLEFRINDCMIRSLNGKKLDSLGREMLALKAYILWLGKDVPEGAKLKGMGIPVLPLPGRSASIPKGEQLFGVHCVSCHTREGGGQLNPDSSAYIYPPLWGPHSYNTGAGMLRISRLAGFIRFNMPYTAVQQTPQLTDEEAWDLAAYLCSQQRPVKVFPEDWPVLSRKPFDYPFGPYADSFPEQQHKYGPFKPIVQSYKKSRQ